MPEVFEVMPAWQAISKRVGVGVYWVAVNGGKKLDLKEMKVKEWKNSKEVGDEGCRNKRNLDENGRAARGGCSREAK